MDYINAIKNPRPLDLGQDYKVWGAKARLFNDIFGIMVNKTGGPNPEDKEQFDFVVSMFEGIQRGLFYGGGVLKGKELKDTPQLYCGNSTLKKGYARRYGVIENDICKKRTYSEVVPDMPAIILCNNMWSPDGVANNGLPRAPEQSILGSVWFHTHGAILLRAL